MTHLNIEAGHQLDDDDGLTDVIAYKKETLCHY
jgi:hypothetical protein